MARSLPFDPAVLRDAPALRAALRAAEFDRQSVAAFLKGGQPAKDLPLLRRRAAGRQDAFHAAVELFLLGLEVGLTTVEVLFTRQQTEVLATAGLLQNGRGGWRATAQLAPAPEGNGWLASDFTLDLTRLADDHVLGVGAASDTLASLTPRRAFRRALDLGCGAGCQALLASTHCGQVIGTDISERALNFARFNARFNGAENIEFRMGSFFEPVGGERFDLLVANPPFVISPESERIFRTGSAHGDRVSEHVVRAAPAHLEEGGLAVILINWHHQHEEDWTERPVAWTAGNGCDSWLLRFGSDEPLVYAAEWLRTEGKTSEALGAALDRWSSYYQRLDIGRISAGAMVLRKRAAGGTWTRADTLTFGAHAGPCGAHIERVVAGETLAQEATDETLLGGRFRLGPDHLVDTHLRHENGGWVQGPLTLRPQPGLAFSGRLDGPLLQILGGLDGNRPLGEVLAACAGSLGLDAAALRDPGLGAIRKLLRAGFLEA